MRSLVIAAAVLAGCARPKPPQCREQVLSTCADNDVRQEILALCDAMAKGERDEARSRNPYRERWLAMAHSMIDAALRDRCSSVPEWLQIKRYLQEDSDGGR